MNLELQKRERMYEEINQSINIDDRENIRKKDSDSRWLKHRKSHKPWFEDYLPPDYVGYKLPDYISIRRNQTIVAIIIQIASSIAGLSFFFIRRTSLYLVINSISACLAIFGLMGVIKLKHPMVAIHGVITTAVLGSCFLYSLIEALFGRKSDDAESHNMSEAWIIFLLSLPYLIDFFSGCMSFYFFYLINNLEEQRNPRNRTLEKEDFELPENCDLSEGRACIVCTERPKNCIFYNCGHKITCIGCARELVRKFQPRCPCCRAIILDVIQEYSI